MLASGIIKVGSIPRVCMYVTHVKSYIKQTNEKATAEYQYGSQLYITLFSLAAYVCSELQGNAENINLSMNLAQYCYVLVVNGNLIMIPWKCLIQAT